MWTSKPIGYDTYSYLQNYGYSDDEIKKFVTEGAVKVYEGKKPLKFDKLTETSAKTELP